MNNKICVVGGGYWGKNHIKTLDTLEALGGIVDEDNDTLNFFSKEYPETPLFNSLSEALNSNFINAYTVATPAETHYTIAKKIIESGKPVLVEKPLALSITEAENLVNLAKQRKVNLMVGHLLLFHPAIVKIKEFINLGEIGNLQYIYSNRLNLGQVRTEENVFWSLAPHDISIFQYLTDSYPKNIIAKGSTFLQKGIYDSTITQLEYPNDVEGHIFVSWLHPFKEHRLVVIGSEGMLTFEDSAKDKPLKLFSKKFDLTNKIPEKIDGPVKTIKYENKMPLTEELTYFVQHLNDKSLNIANGDHALDVIRILVEASVQLKNRESNCLKN